MIKFLKEEWHALLGAGLILAFFATLVLGVLGVWE